MNKILFTALLSCLMFSLQGMDNPADQVPAQAAASIAKSDQQKLVIHNDTEQKIQITYHLEGKPIYENIVVAPKEVRYFPLPKNPDQVLALMVKPHGEIKGLISKDKVGLQLTDYKEAVRSILREDSDVRIVVKISTGSLPVDGMLGKISTYATALVPAFLVQAAENYLLAYYVKIEKVLVVGRNIKRELIPDSRKIADVFLAARSRMNQSHDKYFSVETDMFGGVRCISEPG